MMGQGLGNKLSCFLCFVVFKHSGEMDVSSKHICQAYLLLQCLHSAKSCFQLGNEA